MVGRHHWLNGHEFEQAPGVGDGQGRLVCCSPWGHKELDTSEQLNWIENVLVTDISEPVSLDSTELGFCANTLESGGGERWTTKHLWLSPRDMGTAGPKNRPLKFTSICFSTKMCRNWGKDSRRCRRESLILKYKNKFCFVSFTSLFVGCSTRHLGSSSPTRDRTDAPCSGRSLNQRTTKPWTTRKVPENHFRKVFRS